MILLLTIETHIAHFCDRIALFALFPTQNIFHIEKKCDDLLVFVIG